MNRPDGQQCLAEPLPDNNVDTIPMIQEGMRVLDTKQGDLARHESLRYVQVLQ